ncbi:hypothetical protein [Gloeobacter morelensis]|uniref:Uncharacterized protein n=1 Tax=Gloeobacter morelensis MG652769 TaxID=2781736 RepID=A0ABY3PG16_9CYAN|nr:hypothetical protein [Gloeobacter morelensis]UFP92595.1 hypothetical protein ISF26_12135 [Gloeobacter morelensis MG652769]
MKPTIFGVEPSHYFPMNYAIQALEEESAPAADATFTFDAMFRIPDTIPERLVLKDLHLPARISTLRNVGSVDARVIEKLEATQSIGALIGAYDRTFERRALMIVLPNANLRIRYSPHRGNHWQHLSSLEGHGAQWLRKLCSEGEYVGLQYLAIPAYTVAADRLWLSVRQSYIDNHTTNFVERLIARVPKLLYLCAADAKQGAGANQLSRHILKEHPNHALTVRVRPDAQTLWADPRQHATLVEADIEAAIRKVILEKRVICIPVNTYGQFITLSGSTPQEKECSKALQEILHPSLSFLMRSARTYTQTTVAQILKDHLLRRAINSESKAAQEAEALHTEDTGNLCTSLIEEDLTDDGGDAALEGIADKQKQPKKRRTKRAAESA